MLGQQLYALLWRNVLIKRRRKRQTFAEVLLPIYMMVLIVVMKNVAIGNDYPEISTPQGNMSVWDGYVSFPRVGLVPNTSEVQQIKTYMENILQKQRHGITFIVYDTTEEMVKDYKNRNATDALSAGIVFAEKPKENGSYILKLPFKSLPVATVSNLYGKQGDCRSDKLHSLFWSCPTIEYFTSGFSFLQALVDSAILKLWHEKETQVPDSLISIYPKPAYKDQSQIMSIIVPLYIVISFSPLVANLIIAVVYEKEKKIKEAMLIMGLRQSAFWLSWFLVEGLMILVLSIFATAVVAIAGIFQNSSIVVVFLLILLYGLSLVLMAFMLTPFFDKSKTAGTVCGFIVSLFSVTHLLAVYLKDSLSSYDFHFLALLSPAACGIGLFSVVEAESSGQGITGSNMFDGKFPPGSAIIMLVIDTIIYGLLALYFDLVIPGEFGPRQPPWFFLMPSYWTSGGAKMITDEQLNEFQLNGDVEPVPTHMRSKEAIRIVNLKKTFSKCRGQQIKAVDGIDLQIYEDQITSILGHNGAGKTTLINMLVGMTPPTSGSAHIFGLDVSDANDLHKLRCMTGICLQENILIEELTCQDHLTFFAKLKAVPPDRLQYEVENLITELNLDDCKATISKSLSGGQKRKLCVAIALIGDPKIIFLDEPSSGVDPFSRRQMWTLLQKRKEGHVIVLTTHFMDEADILADRKAIVSKGRIRCVGSSFFLKNKFGIGYHLVVEAQDAHKEANNITNLVKSHIESAQLSRTTASELSYLLPLNQTEVFPRLFSAIEGACSSGTHGLRSYGISMTSLEEVFIALGEETADEEENNLNDASEQLHPSYGSSDGVQHHPVVECHPSFRRSFTAFFRARFLLLFRNPRNVVLIVLTPLVLILINYFLLRNSGQNISSDSMILKLTPSLYPSLPVKLKNSSGTQFDEIVSYLNKTGLDSSVVTNLTLPTLQSSFMAIGNLQPISFLVNDSALHYLPIAQNLLSNFYAQSTVKEEKSLEVFTEPFPKTDKESESSIVFDGLLYTWTILLSTTLGYLPPTIVMEVVEDREAHIKGQLRVSGLGFGLYWLITALTHSLLLLVPLLVLVIGIVAMNIFDSAIANLAMAILCLLYIPSSLLYSYVISFIFDRQDTAKRSMPTIAFVVSFIPMIVIFMVQTFASTVSTALHIVFCLLSPLYCPAGGMFFIVQVNQKLKFEKAFGSPASESAYFEASNNVLVTYILMIVNVLIYLLALRVIDVAKSGGRIRDAFQLNPGGQQYVVNPESVLNEDPDIEEERRKVASFDNTAQPPVLLIKEMGKEYVNLECCIKRISSKTAVRNLSLAVESGHIFGLLGPNGAGKTSTMRMVISEESPTYGQINVAGYNVTSNLSAAFQMMGYCPQHDALWEKLTLREHIRLYAAIRGISPEEIETVCSKMIGGLNVDEHADKQIKELSGGTKRKLSYILAMIGSPQLVLLDEPSTGMDPQSKRFLWNTICAAFPVNGNRTVLLTTHSMEEAEILCTRIGIMVNGYLRCLGSTQHLKNRYGSGYSLEVKVRDIDKIRDLIAFVSELFADCQLKEQFGNRITFMIPKTSVPSIAKTFASIEQAVSELGIEEYSFSQTSLEQVFIEFAKQQEDA